MRIKNEIIFNWDIVYKCIFLKSWMREVIEIDWMNLVSGQNPLVCEFWDWVCGFHEQKCTFYGIHDFIKFQLYSLSSKYLLHF